MANTLHAFSAQVTTVVDIDADHAVAIKALVLLNTTAAIAYIQMFKAAASAVTLGTTAPDHVIPLPASSGVSLNISDGWRFGGAAISLGATTTRTGNTTAACDVFITYS